MHTPTKMHRGTHTTSRGFTIVEMLVTVAIFAMISGVLLARNSKFDDESLLQAAAYDVALSVRHAQSYGINVRGQAGSFDNAYGIAFDEATTSYAFFIDTDGDDAFDENELIERYQLGRGYSIGRICLFASIDPSCDDMTDEVAIVFRRPNPEAIITESGGSAGAVVAVGIELVSPRGGQRFIIVRQTGQVGVERFGEDEL